MNQLSVPLSSFHNKNDFSCGNDMLDNYLKLQASQDVKRKLAACFILLENNSDIIQGYYTLSNNSIPLNDIPSKIQKKLPRSYASIPTILIGRLAIEKKFQGKGIGKILLIDALNRCYEISKNIGSFAVIVDPIDESAENFYNKYGFIKLQDSGKMFLAMKTVGQLFE